MPCALTHVCTPADTLLENLTVSEMLMYTAELKLPLKLTPAAKRERVAVLLQQLALTACQSVKIGGAMNKGISGERLASPGRQQQPCMSKPAHLVGQRPPRAAACWSWCQGCWTAGCCQASACRQPLPQSP